MAIIIMLEMDTPYVHTYGQSQLLNHVLQILDKHMSMKFLKREHRLHPRQ